MKLLSLFLCYLLLLPISAFTQTVVTGKIVDEKRNPLPGVNIILKGTFEGTSSLVTGDYLLKISSEEPVVLLFRLLGYKPVETQISPTGDSMSLDEVRLVEEITQLDAVTISAGAMQASDESKAVILKPLDIVTTPSAMGDVVAALQTLPGTSTVGNDGRLFVRGGDASEVGIYIDGLRVGNAYGSTMANVPTRTRFNPTLFKGTFFSTGGYSAEYGQALSSTLALNTKDIAVRSQGDISLMSVGVGYSQAIANEKQSFTLSGNYFDLSPYQKLVKQDFDWERSPYGGDLEVSAQQKTKKGGLVKFLARTETNGMKLWQPQPGEENKGLLVQLKNNYSYAQTNWRQAYENGWTLFAGAAFSYNRDKIQYSEINVDQKGSLSHGKVTATKDFSDRLAAKSGVEVFIKNYSESLPNENLTRQYDDLESYFFTEWDWYLSKKLVWRGGARLGYSELAKKTCIDPRISVAYQLSKQGQLSIAAGRFHQFPVDNFRILNPKVGNMISKHLILNYLYSNDGRTFRAEAFYKSYDKLITFEGDPLTPIHLKNTGYGEATGFDFFFRDRKTFKNTDYWISYGFVKSERLYDQYLTRVQPDYAPRHNFSLVAKHFISGLKSQVGVSLAVNDGYSYTNPNEAGEMNSKTKAYQSLSVSWNYLPKPNLIIHFAVNNVLGRENVFGYTFTKEPDENGFYALLPNGQGTPRFLFLGVFLTLSKDKSANQLNNL